MTPEQLEKKVDERERGLNLQQGEILKLQRQVASLTATVQHLFVLAGSVQRFSEQQENAFRRIPGLLRQLEHPED